MESTIIQQGRFTADGTAEVIKLRSDVDWMYVKNYTTTLAGGAGTGVEFRWQKGMADDTAFEYQKLAADESMVPVVAATGGFTYVNTQTSNPLSAINATITAISGAAIPIATAGSTAGLVDGSIVRLINPLGALQFGGVDFTIDTIVANTSFALANAPQIVASALAGSFYIVNVPQAFYPKKRTIALIDQDATATTETTVDHGFTVGQKVRYYVPDTYGMTQIDGLEATVLAVTAAGFTTDINSTAFTAFAWPLTAAGPFQHAEVVPVGQASGSPYANLLDGATVDEGYIAMSLATGTDSPAGAANDVIYWMAGKSFSVDNE